MCIRDRYKNSWGYILGNGSIIHTSPPVPYGESFGLDDNVLIEYKDGVISFYKNGHTPGPAFKGIKGPFYLAVALSDTSHSVEIIEVTELIHCSCSYYSHTLHCSIHNTFIGVLGLSLIHICRCRRYAVCRSRWSPYH
eukprot:TRINITY_DN837_c0_g1_i1.p1 TRINITY_DN837_c0_g1~~TRINITY_DN837_c0_g1_i1.p1  ORF type:complete len:138 (+),score=25.83 TRINITY_DN837_c0_g1_i1:72-485(+)